MARTLKASGNVNPSRFVTISGSFSVAESNSTELPIGVSHESTKAFNSALAAAANDELTVYVEDDECLLMAGSAITYGDKLAPDNDGKAIPAGSADYGAIALESGSSGELIKVKINLGEVS